MFAQAGERLNIDVCTHCECLVEDGAVRKYKLSCKSISCPTCPLVTTIIFPIIILNSSFSFQSHCTVLFPPDYYLQRRNDLGKKNIRKYLMASNVKHGFLLFKHDVFRVTPFRRTKVLAVVTVFPQPASLKNLMAIKSAYR